jgi:choline transport protein
MIGIYVVNMVFTFASWLVLCFALPDVPAALEHASTYPVIYIMEQSTSPGWITVELVMIIALVLFANVCYITAVSRDLWAFARDNGVPFSPWIYKVSAELKWVSLFHSLTFSTCRFTPNTWYRSTQST